jgi:hypothetical protein
MIWKLRVSFLGGATIMKYRLQPPGIEHRILRNLWALLRNVKVNFILEQATKTHRGSRDIVVLFLEPRR